MNIKTILTISLFSAAAVMIYECMLVIPMVASLVANPILHSLILFLTMALTMVLSVSRLHGKRHSQDYSLLDTIEAGIFVIDPSGKILFHNAHFQSIFHKISNWLPIKTIEELPKYNYFDFYLNPDEQRTQFFQLTAPSKRQAASELHSTLDIGSEIISARAVPLSPDKPKDSRILVTWELITRESNQRRLEKVVEEQMENTSGELTEATEALMASSVKVEDIAKGTSKQAQDVASFSREVTDLILKLAEAVNQSSSKIDVIADNVENSREISETALEESRSTRRLITELSDMAGDIYKTTETIQEIMAQTHVLSLNATIEASKSGEAGKGFAVIANEVGNLAKQTASMSEAITAIVDQIIEKIPLSVSSIETVESVVRKMNGITLSIHDLMEEQTRMMATMSDHMHEANQNSEQITQRMDEVVNYSYNTLEQIDKSQSAGRDIESISQLFQLLVSRFGEERIVTPNDIYYMLSIIQQLIDAWIEKETPDTLHREISSIPIKRFEGKKPANVLKTSIENYQLFLGFNQLPMEEIPFPKGTVTPTQTYNFLCRMMESLEEILIAKGYEKIRQLKIARPVTGKNPNDAYAVAHQIHEKLDLISKNGHA